LEREAIDRLGGFVEDAGQLELNDSAAEYAQLRAVWDQLQRSRTGHR